LNIVDLVIIVIVLLGAIGGYRKGFVGSLVGFFSSILGLVAACNFYPQLARFLNTRFELQGKMSAFFQEHLVLPQPVSQFRLGQLPLPDISRYLDSVNLDASLKFKLLSFVEKLQTSLALPLQTSMGDIVNQFLATALVSALSFLIIWAAVSLLLQAFAHLYSAAIRNTFLGKFDRLGGMAAGAALAILTLTIFIGLVMPFLDLAGIAKPTLFSSSVKTIEEAKLVPYFYSLYNILFSKFISLLPL
jgi:uncharacterized membrane protein required for colicin V production